MLRRIASLALLALAAAAIAQVLPSSPAGAGSTVPGLDGPSDPLASLPTAGDPDLDAASAFAPPSATSSPALHQEPRPMMVGTEAVPEPASLAALALGLAAYARRRRR